MATRKKAKGSAIVGDATAISKHLSEEFFGTLIHRTKKNYPLLEMYFGINKKAHFMDYHMPLSGLITCFRNLNKNGPCRSTVDECARLIADLTELGIPSEGILPRNQRKTWLTMLADIKPFDILHCPASEDSNEDVRLRRKDNSQTANFFRMMPSGTLMLTGGNITGLQSFVSMLVQTLPQLEDALEAMVVELNEKDFNRGTGLTLLKKVVNDKNRKGVKCEYRTRRVLAENLRNPRHKDKYAVVARSLKYKNNRLWTTIPPGKIRIIS